MKARYMILLVALTFLALRALYTHDWLTLGIDGGVALCVIEWLRRSAVRESVRRSYRENGQK